MKEVYIDINKELIDAIFAIDCSEDADEALDNIVEEFGVENVPKETKKKSTKKTTKTKKSKAKKEKKALDELFKDCERVKIKISLKK